MINAIASSRISGDGRMGDNLKTHFFVKEFVPIRVASKCVITIAQEVYAMLQWTVRARESYVISGAFVVRRFPDEW